ncbi:MAG: ADP-glyceromanno-heptose 6-epimerase [Bacteroidota bacterium]
MIVITGAAGFIGSCLLGKLNNKGIKDIVIVDDFNRPEKELNYRFKSFKDKVDRNIFIEWFKQNHNSVDFVYHLGARTDTAEFDSKIFDELNLNYSKEIWNLCVKFQKPLVYASSAATYGMGEHGYKDDHNIIESLKPLNPYGESKNDFDKWVLKQNTTPPFWAGLKFFNVFGPNEYHKSRMASVVFHAFNQINEKGSVKLFKSHHPDFKDGMQLRDFIYVKDLTRVCYYLLNHKIESGIYNLGTGKARSFLDLVNATFTSLGKEPNIEFIDTPIDIRDKYQYFTEADMSKLILAGYNQPFFSLEKAIDDYIQSYLIYRNRY